MITQVDKIDGDILSIKFEGKALMSRSLPIYELASSLTAIQRIINKAALFSEGKLEKDAHLPTRRREELALQVSSHNKGSDLWGLRPYLTDPALGPIFQNLVSAFFVAVAAYVSHKILMKKESPKNQTLIVNIFPEVKSLTDRIGNIGGVERIELLGRQVKSGQGLIIDSETQEYVRELQNQLVPGKPMIVSGVVTRLLPQSFRFDICDAPGHYIRIVMDGDIFDKVRRLPILTEREIKFEGVPMYRFGDPVGGMREFHAHRIILQRNKN
jgi:hypothetical protein